jgi:hypothetical protein
MSSIKSFVVTQLIPSNTPNFSCLIAKIAYSFINMILHHFVHCNAGDLWTWHNVIYRSFRSFAMLSLHSYYNSILHKTIQIQGL